MKPKKEDNMNNKSLKIKRITGIAVFAALVVVLQLFSNYVQFGPVSITLALIPIVVGSIIYGPLAGFALGAVGGFLVFIAPSTIGLFWDYGVFITFLVCVLKMALAGMVSGLLYKAFNNKSKKLAVTLSSICVPIINTGLFAIAALLFYKDLLVNLNTTGQNTIAFLFFTFIGFNFLIEFAVNSILSPVVLRLINMTKINNAE